MENHQKIDSAVYVWTKNPKLSLRTGLAEVCPFFQPVNKIMHKIGVSKTGIMHIFGVARFFLITYLITNLITYLISNPITCLQFHLKAIELQGTKAPKNEIIWTNLKLIIWTYSAVHVIIR